MPSRTVCFVCGSVGAELSIHIKSRDKGPYFPFLEHHDPPKGSRLPGPDGLVDSCRVCYAFLTQQWEAYERSKTPAIKRLYWLKRADNGHFTGAEMKLQGEYMAQVMGLQYQTTSDSYNTSSSPERPSYSRDGYLISSNHHPRDPPRSHHTVHQAPDGALDLSVGPTKVVTDVARAGHSQRHVVRDSFTCFTCGKEKQISNCKLASAIRQAGSEPYFPFLEKIVPPRGASSISSQGLVQLCEHCFAALFQQWLSYERAGVPPSARMYSVGDDHMTTKSLSAREMRESYEKEKTSDAETCYLCGQSYPIKSIRPLYTIPSQENKFVMYFPFIRELRRPHGSRPLNPDGTVLVCQNCHHNLQSQWCHYEAKKIPLIQRRYSLLPVSGSYTVPLPDKPHHSKESEKPHPKPPSDGSDVTQPLNIQISKSPLPSSLPGSAQGLLAIAQPMVKTEAVEGQGSSVTSTISNSVNNALAAKVLEHHRQLTETKPSSSGASIPHPLQQATSIPKKVCFICGEKCLITKARTLCSYPMRHEAKTPNSQSAPFFPFLASRDPAPGAELNTEDGTVIACSYCFCSLNTQWKEFEESKDPEDHKRWVRKYSVQDFICFVCGTTVARKAMRTLEVHKFPFLKEHKAPSRALVFSFGEEIGACSSCAFSLRHQFAENERMGVPDDHRKYNWIQQPHQPQVIEENSSDSRDQDATGSDLRGYATLMSCDDDSNNTNPDNSRQGDGLPQGSKPPPLNMLSPSGSKVARNTATVPPLNQVSPSNGLNSVSGDAALSATRTSSFAAALRKLAHQAKDPEDPSSIKHTSPPSSSVSPRSSTPKRAPPPLVYASQAQSLTSPPVVTIAPTQAHPSVLNDSRQGLERVSSAHSTSSSIYEPLSLKQERDQRPLSSHSRDDDRSSMKDGPHGQTPSRILTPHSTPGSREDGLVRGFQPYRPGDEIRPPVPLPFGMDPATYQAAYQQAFIQPHPYTHPAYRLEDPMMLERYRMMQPPYLPFASTGSTGAMMPHPGMHPLLAGGRYPPELLHQYPFLSPSAPGVDPRSPAMSAERSRAEEDRQRELDREREREREREKEKEREREREKEREKEREREAEIQRLREQQREIERERQKILERHNDLTNSHNSVLTVPLRGRHHEDMRGRHHEDLRGRPHDDMRVRDSRQEEASKFGSITQGTPRDPGCRGSSESSYNKDVRWQDVAGPRREHDRNHYHHKLPDIPSVRHQASMSESGRRYMVDHPESDHSRCSVGMDRGQPPPLVSPRGQGDASRGEKSADGAIFRPFEKPAADSQYSQYSQHLQNSKSADLSVPAYRRGSHDREQNGDVRERFPDSMERRDNSMADGYDHHQLKKPINMTHSNHNIERFDFKSLATEFSHLPKAESQSVDSRALIPFSDTSYVQKQCVENHVRSKLDIEEQKLRDSRVNGTYCSDSEDDALSDEEERRLQHLMFITRVPPLKFEASPPKMKLLGELGLVTLRRKKDIQYERLRKRRKLHRERSISPVEVEEENCSPLPHPSLAESDALCHDNDYPDKCQFLHSMDLGPLGRDKKKELDQIRTFCEQEKQRRLGVLEENNRVQMNGDGDNLPETSGCGVKRKFDEMENMSSQSEPAKISLSQLQARHQKQGKPSNHVKSSAVVFPESRDRQLSREFAEQFHESVLQTTRQKEIASRLGARGQEESYSSRPLEQSQGPTLRNNASGESSGSTRETDISDYGANPGFRWPGIEAIIDSYQRYVEEQRLERHILTDRCRRLRADNMDLNRTAERLSHRVSSLLDAKQHVEGERAQAQSAIDSMKRCLKYLR